MKLTELFETQGQMKHLIMARTLRGPTKEHKKALDKARMSARARKENVERNKQHQAEFKKYRDQPDVIKWR